MEIELLTASQVANILGTSEWFIYKHRKLFAGIKIAGVVRFEKSMVMEVLHERLQASREVSIRLGNERSANHR